MELGPLDLAAQHLELVAENGDLDVLGLLAAQASQQHADKQACHEVEEGQGHRPIVSDPDHRCSAHRPRFLNPTGYATSRRVDNRLPQLALPTMTDREVYNAARGWWRLNQRAEQQKYAIVVAGGRCRIAIEINEWSKEGDRRAFDGRILPPGDRVLGPRCGADQGCRRR